jgi:hypothetical protein
MATTITWDIAQLERETADGYVFTAHWTVVATDGIYASNAYGSVGFERPEALIPYADLTKETVIAWVKQAIGGADKIQEIESALQTMLGEQKSPTKASGTPWS